MDITINREELITKISKCSQILEKKGEKDGTGNANCKLILVANKKESVLKLIAINTNLQIYIISTIAGVKIKEEGTILLYPNTLLSFLKNISALEVDVRLYLSGKDKDKLFIKSKIKLVNFGVSIDSTIPNIPRFTDLLFSFDASSFRYAIKNCAYSILDSDNKIPVLSNLSIQSGDGNIVDFYAANVITMTNICLSAIESKKLHSILLNKNAINLLEILLAGSENVLNIYNSDGNSLYITLGDYVIIVGTFNGKYPDIKTLLTKSYTKNVTINIKQLSSILKDIEIVQNHLEEIVVFDIMEDKLELSSINKHNLSSACGEILLSTVTPGQTASFKFNYLRLLNIISTITEEEIIFSWENTASPVLIEVKKASESKQKKSSTINTDREELQERVSGVVYRKHIIVPVK